MLENERKWSDCTDEEKLLIIEGYLEGMVALDDTNRQVNNQRLEWIREHIPAYNLDDGKNYIFVSYSHLDYKEVYKDLAVFSYNSQRRVRFWYDEGLPIGQNWEEAAGKIIKNPHCVGVLFYLSKNLLLSPSVYKEIECVKNSGKSYCQVALSDTLYSAAKIFDDAKGSELRGVRQHQDELEEFFPDNETALISYGKENAISRIEKIARQFDVTEEVFSDFVCEECEGGLSLIEYRGIKTEVHIPEKIGDKPIVKITAEFPHAVSVYIPKTVLVIHRSIFDNAINLEEIIVDADNTNYYDINGVLCGRDYKYEYLVGSCENSIRKKKQGNALLRAPICWDWRKQFLDYNSCELINVGGVFAENNVSNIDDCSLYTMPDLLTSFNSELLNKYGELFYFILCFFKDTEKEDIYKLEFAIYNRKLSKLYKLLKKLKHYSVFNSIHYVSEGAFKSCKKLNYIFLPNNIKAIECLAFKDSSLILIFLPAQLKVLEWGVFHNCLNLQSVLTITDYYNKKLSYLDETFNKVLLFGNIQLVIDSFYNNAISGLEYNENIVFKHLGFNKCVWLRELKIPGKTQKLLGAFSECVRLEKVEIEDGIEWLIDICFNDCLCLVNVKIPKTVKFIEDTCFLGCPNLCVIEYGGTMAEWRLLENAKYDKDGLHYGLESELCGFKIICTDGVIEPSENT